MKALLALSTLAALAFARPAPPATGLIGVYAIVERIEFEPNEGAAERVRLFGAFSFVDGGVAGQGTRSVARRGHMYLGFYPARNGPPPEQQLAAARREWADIKSVAGAGQAIGFGSWGYLGQFPDRARDWATDTSQRIRIPMGLIDFGAPPYDSATKAFMDAPDGFQPNVGVVKLSEASHSAIITVLRNALRREE